MENMEKKEIQAMGTNLKAERKFLKKIQNKDINTWCICVERNVMCKKRGRFF